VLGQYLRSEAIGEQNRLLAVRATAASTERPAEESENVLVVIFMEQLGSQRHLGGR
jgi:hypothetical protein